MLESLVLTIASILPLLFLEDEDSLLEKNLLFLLTLLLFLLLLLLLLLLSLPMPLRTLLELILLEMLGRLLLVS